MKHEPLSTTVLEEEPVCYDLYEQGSKRGKPLLAGSDGFRYYVKKTLKSSVLWTCSARSAKVKCYATVVQKGGEYTRGSNSHQHAPEPSLSQKVKLNLQAKNEAQRHVYQSVPEIVSKALKEHLPPNQPGMPVPESVDRSANRYRSKFRPAEPKDLEFVVDNDYLQCQDFLVADIRNGSARHMIFATEEQLTLLSNTRRWFMDGTFKVVGEPFSSGQLESIHGFVTKDGIEKQVPMAFILMSRKRTEDYVKVLTAIHDALEHVVVENFVMDFEQAAWLAVRQVFPGASIKGCVFHFTQAIWRKVIGLGMKPAYLQRDSVHQYIRQIMALPFLPSAHTEQAFEELEGRANSDQLVALVTYVEKQWMNHAILDIQSWSVFGLTVRTNNDCEGWHNKLNLKAGNQALTLYRLIPVLRSEAERVPYELRLLRDGVSTRRVRQRYANIETKIRELWDMYKADQISTSKLLQDCAKVYGPQCEVSGEEEETVLVTRL
ncbi:uncharacterized protein LOC123535774 isoform X2 [Mercenaria mercenaria]|uniref:uncharacterized protein LOC123535774 isoform X2 n=1 Tax=Mercenaria mercenaria TaxID=6596 RepID=UPI00234E7092|nr:uncharacterized protein LOC123535774 isoform X2 [Mercenaria mercenaria]